MEYWAAQELKYLQLGDARLNRRLVCLTEDLPLSQPPAFLRPARIGPIPIALTGFGILCESPRKPFVWLIKKPLSNGYSKAMGWCCDSRYHRIELDNFILLQGDSQ